MPALPRLHEPKEPYDDDDPSEKTPKGRPRRIERCVPCGATGRIHLVRGGRTATRGRPCPFCRGRGFRMVDVDP